MSLSSDRSWKILNAVVQDYIQTAEPVSSKAIADRYALGLSPATIRSIMAELESEGFLYQPHTSAGRVPTDKSFRRYVDNLMALVRPSEADGELLKRDLKSLLNTENVVPDAARALSSLTSCAGLMFIPRKDNFVIKAVNLLVLDSTTLMMVLVSTLGTAQTRLIRLGPEAGSLDIERITNYLNGIAEGQTVSGLRARIVAGMKVDRNRYDELLSKALKLGAMAFEHEGGPSESDLYVEGKVNIFDQPEFRDDFERMKRLFSAFEEKSLLVKILDKTLEPGGAHIWLGSESGVEEFNGLGIVAAPYGPGSEVLGTIGVMGPVRMDYSKIIPLVNYTAELLGRLF